MKAIKNNQSAEAPQLGSSDKNMIRITFILALMISIPISLMTGAEPDYLNQMWLERIPVGLRILMLIMPVMMYFGIKLIRETRYEELKAIREKKEKELASAKVNFRCFYRPHQEGCDWVITNLNRFSWQQAKLIVERRLFNDVSTEKFNLGSLGPGEKMTVSSEVHDDVQAHWRIMLITRDGRKMDFPVRWTECDIKKLVHF